MECQFCHRIVTQDEADRAHEIYPCDLTQCEECAAANKQEAEKEEAR
jgi:hypothetical protein